MDEIIFLSYGFAGTVYTVFVFVGYIHRDLDLR